MRKASPGPRVQRTSSETMHADCIIPIPQMISSSTILLQKDLFGCVAGAETVNDKVAMNLNVICVWCHASSPREILQI